MTDDLPNARTTEHSRARWTTYLLYACLALDLVAIASGLAQHGLLSRVAAGEHLLPQEARANDARQGAIGRLQILAFIITGIVWLVWLQPWPRGHEEVEVHSRLGRGLLVRSIR